jgi:hypothetical protein
MADEDQRELKPVSSEQADKLVDYYEEQKREQNDTGYVLLKAFVAGFAVLIFFFIVFWLRTKLLVTTDKDAGPPSVYKIGIFIATVSVLFMLVSLADPNIAKYFTMGVSASIGFVLFNDLGQ